MAKHQKSKLLIYLEYGPFCVLYWFLHTLSLKAAYRLEGVLFHILYLVAWRLRNRTVNHLLHAHVAKNRKEAHELALRTFIEFGKLLVEIVKMHQCYDPAKVKVVGPADTVRRAFTQPGSPSETNVIIVTAHYGNWEVAGTAVSDQAGRSMVSIMRPFSNPLIGEKILSHRRSGIHELVDKGPSGLRHMLKALATGRNVSVLIDQHASTSEGVETVFFGQPCRTHKTPALLHLKTGVPILPELTRRVNDNFEFELVVGDLIEYKPTGDHEKDVQTVTQLCTTALEKLIAERPEQWLWTHRRWLNIDRNQPKAQTPQA